MGKTIALELMEHISIPCDWKVCVSQGCSFSIQSNLENGLIAGGTARSDDSTIPGKVHTHINWKRNQDAVFFLGEVKFSRAQRAITVHNPVADCTYRVISQKGDRT